MLCRPVATALIQLLAWELPYAAGVALKKKKKKIPVQDKAFFLQASTGLNK